MRPRFQADADFNHKIVVGLRRREPSVDFLGAHDGRVIRTVSADKRSIKLAIEAGVEIPGATLITVQTTLARK